MVAFIWALRPFYVSFAQHELWADPVGQWIGASEAAPVYELCGLDEAFTSSPPPAINELIIKSSIGFHGRSGVHGLERSDWEQYMKFMEYHFMIIKPRSVEEVYSSPF